MFKMLNGTALRQVHEVYHSLGRQRFGGSFPGAHSLKQDASGSQPLCLSPKSMLHAYCQQYSESRCSVVWGLGEGGGYHESSTVVCSHFECESHASVVVPGSAGSDKATFLATGDSDQVYRWLINTSLPKASVHRLVQRD